ncbi:MAG: hypothetical protein ABI318_02740 [Chthoniobacteraceae bacterium]
MSDALRDYKRLPISQRITFVRASVTLQQATTSPIPHPYANLAGLDTLTTTAEETDSQITALETQLRTLRALRVTQVDAVITEFENNVRHIESDSKGEASMIIACGLAIAGAHAPAGAMTQPQNFTVTASDNEGAADWHCDPVAGFTTMEVESTTTPDNPASWVLHEPVTTSRGTITGLASGVRRYFRVRARSSKGAGPWSDIAWRMVP